MIWNDILMTSWVVFSAPPAPPVPKSLFCLLLIQPSPGIYCFYKILSTPLCFQNLLTLRLYLLLISFSFLTSWIRLLEPTLSTHNLSLSLNDSVIWQLYSIRLYQLSTLVNFFINTRYFKSGIWHPLHSRRAKMIANPPKIFLSWFSLLLVLLVHMLILRSRGRLFKSRLTLT